MRNQKGEILTFRSREFPAGPPKEADRYQPKFDLVGFFAQLIGWVFVVVGAGLLLGRIWSWL